MHPLAIAGPIATGRAGHEALPHQRLAGPKRHAGAVDLDTHPRAPRHLQRMPSTPKPVTSVMAWTAASLASEAPTRFSKVVVAIISS